MPATRHISGSTEATEGLGARCAAVLRPGDVVTVVGSLGSGKTTFIRGACRALGVSEPVTSPTYVIGQLYRGHVPIAHLDLYRLHGLSGEDPALLDDYLTADRIAFIEWPAAEVRGIGKPRLNVEIAYVDEHIRELTFRGDEPLP